MTFAHPWLLLGALAALIPVLVHLFDRRRPRPHPFAAISFVLRSQRRTASRLKLRRLLLYTLRTLILLALPLALARPQWVSKGQALRAAQGPAATVILLDASLSTRYRDGAPLFERGRELARDALKELLAEEPAALLVCAGATPHMEPLSYERSRVRTEIDAARPTYSPADLNQCLDQAAKGLEESPVPGKRIVVISAFPANALKPESKLPTVKGANGELLRPEVLVKDMAPGKAVLPNSAVVDLKVEPALQVGPRAFQLTFTVRNFGPEAAKDVVATLKVGDHVVAKGFLDLPARGMAQKTLIHTFEAGGYYTGEVAVGADALAEDDHRAFALNVPKELRALIVNGAPNAVRYRDEAFFVEAALSAAGSPVRAQVKDAESAFHESLDAYDLVFLLNVRAPPPDAASKLVAWVKRGGGLFVSAGDQVEPDAYNAQLGEVLPRPLRLVKTAAQRDQPDAEAKAAKLGPVAFDHPLFAPFTGRAREGLLGARFYRYVLLESASRPIAEPSTVLATYEDGAPALALARRERGRVLLYTSTVDRDWADLSIRTAFLPLMQRAAALLAGSLEEREERRVRVGQSLSLKAEGPQAASVTDGRGKDVPIALQRDGVPLVGPVPEPGAYTVRDASGRGLDGLSFIAVLDPSASDLTRLKPDELSAYFGEEAVRGREGPAATQHTPVWTWLILAATLAFFFEGVLLRKV